MEGESWELDAVPVNSCRVPGSIRVPTQYQPQNLNASIRVASPGDNGPVTQTIAAITQTTATTVNTIAQTVGQTLAASTPAPIPTIPLPTVSGHGAARAAGCPRRRGADHDDVQTASALTAAVVPRLPVVVLPTVVVPAPDEPSRARVGAAARPPGRRGAPEGALATAFTPQPQQAVGAGPRAPGPADVRGARRPALARARAARSLTAAAADLVAVDPAERVGRRRIRCSGASAAAAAVAALLASYLLVPPFGARAFVRRETVDVSARARRGSNGPARRLLPRWAPLPSACPSRRSRSVE